MFTSGSLNKTVTRIAASEKSQRAPASFGSGTRELFAGAAVRRVWVSRRAGFRLTRSPSETGSNPGRRTPERRAPFPDGGLLEIPFFGISGDTFAAKGDAKLNEKNIIELKNITVRFDGETILDNLNLSIRDGEFVTLLG